MAAPLQAQLQVPKEVLQSDATEMERVLEAANARVDALDFARGQLDALTKAGHKRCASQSPPPHTCCPGTDDKPRLMLPNRRVCCTFWSAWVIFIADRGQQRREHHACNQGWLLQSCLGDPC